MVASITEIEMEFQNEGGTRVDPLHTNCHMRLLIQNTWGRGNPLSRLFLIELLNSIILTYVYFLRPGFLGGALIEPGGGSSWCRAPTLYSREACREGFQ